MTSLDSEIVNDRYSHVGMSFQTKRQDGNTDEKHWHYANTLKKIFYQIHYRNKKQNNLRNPIWNRKVDLLLILLGVV